MNQQFLYSSAFEFSYEEPWKSMVHKQVELTKGPSYN